MKNIEYWKPILIVLSLLCAGWSCPDWTTKEALERVDLLIVGEIVAKREFKKLDRLELDVKVIRVLKGKLEAETITVRHCMGSKCFSGSVGQRRL